MYLGGFMLAKKGERLRAKYLKRAIKAIGVHDPVTARVLEGKWGFRGFGRTVSDAALANEIGCPVGEIVYREAAGRLRVKELLGEKPMAEVA
jgi:hypothetical protein